MRDAPSVSKISLMKDCNMNLIEKISDGDYQPIIAANPANQRDRTTGLICAALGVLVMVFAVEANAVAAAFYQQ